MGKLQKTKLYLWEVPSVGYKVTSSCNEHQNLEMIIFQGDKKVCMDLLQSAIELADAVNAFKGSSDSFLVLNELSNKL